MFQVLDTVDAHCGDEEVSDSEKVREISKQYSEIVGNFLGSLLWDTLREQNVLYTCEDTGAAPSTPTTNQ